MHTCIINTTICIGEGQSLVGLDLLTGKEQWRINTDGPKSQYISNIFASEDMVYIINGGGAIEAYNINSKSKKWTYEHISEYNYPTLANGIIYSFGSDKLVAIDAKTGKEKWAYGPDSKWFLSWNSPCVVLKGDKVYIGLGNIKP